MDGGGSWTSRLVDLSATFVQTRRLSPQLPCSGGYLSLLTRRVTISTGRHAAGYDSELARTLQVCPQRSRVRESRSRVSPVNLNPKSEFTEQWTIVSMTLDPPNNLACDRRCPPLVGLNACDRHS